MTRVCLLFLVALFLPAAVPGQAAADRPAPRLLLAHYMPWFEAKPHGAQWGWHWTMNARDPERVIAGKRAIASHFYPLIGPYDSGDPAVLEYHLLLMKLAGIDGVIVDWYGLQAFRDYPLLHRNTGRLIERAARLGMRFAVCYEDQTVPALVAAGKLKPDDRVAHVAGEIAWLAKHWFALPGYVRIDGRPLLLSFGQTGLTDDEWSRCLRTAKTPVAYFSQHHRRTAAVGAFDWPVPGEGLPAARRFVARTPAAAAIPVAYPRFVDYYAEARVHKSYGRIGDDGGRTFRTSLGLALATAAPVVQLATWNDWGEGTGIEPTRDFAYRDLEVVQELRRKHLDPRFAATAADLRLPHRLFELRRTATGAERARELDSIADRLASGKLAEARTRLHSAGAVDR